MQIFTEGVRKKAFRAYVHILAGILEACGFSQADFLISKREFASALIDTRTDCEFLRKRRPLRKGISRGKLAGILVFRLCRSHVLTPGRNHIEDPLALRVPVDAALAFGLAIAGVPFECVPETVIRELKYYLAKRHINQEALGICFDALSACRSDRRGQISGKLQTLESQP